MRTTAGRYRTALLVTGLALGVSLTGFGVASGDDDGFCDLLRDTVPTFHTEPLAALRPDAGAGEWRAHFALTRQRHQRLGAAAPAEVSAAVTRLQTTNDQLADFYALAEYSPQNVDAGALTQLLSDTGHADAVTQLTAFARDRCDIDVGSLIRSTP